jgi:hypothetical protein
LSSSTSKSPAASTAHRQHVVPHPAGHSVDVDGVQQAADRR